jgi:hypothetical protein
MNEQAQKTLVADLKLIVEGYRSMAEGFEKELNAQTSRLKDAEWLIDKQDAKIRVLQGQLKQITGNIAIVIGV